MFRDHLGSEAEAGHAAALAGPMGAFFRVGVNLTTKTGVGLGNRLLREDVEGWHGDGTLTWGGGTTLAWFIDRKNDLCEVGAVQSALPVDGAVIEELKQNFPKDIYIKYAA